MLQNIPVDRNIKKLCTFVANKKIPLQEDFLIIDDYFSHIVSFDICSLTFNSHYLKCKEKKVSFYFHISKEEFEQLFKASDTQIKFEWFPNHLNANVTIKPLGECALESF